MRFSPPYRNSCLGRLARWLLLPLDMWFNKAADDLWERTTSRT